jgi:hypothetical protein
MPAIQPARLKRQASELASKFTQPALFVRELHALLYRYSDHTHRSGQANIPSSLRESYNTPLPVMRQVWQELKPWIKSHPAGVLPLCDALWAESNYDILLLAARLLGQAPIEPPDLVIEHLQSWISQGIDRQLLDKLLEYGLPPVQQAAPVQLLDLVSSWLASSDLATQQVGLRALLHLIDSSVAENLPTIFRMLTPFLRIAPFHIRPDIISILTALAQSSPSETAFFLRQNLATPNNPDTAWLIRQVLGEFPPDTRSALRTALKEQG